VRVKLKSLHLAAMGCVGDCSIDAADKAHPNKLPFSGTLLILDTASNKPPHGSEGHRIYVPTATAKRRLNTLINMGLNYASTLDTHAPRRKVGVITGAWIDGKKLMVRGFIWKKDFPEAAKDLKQGRIGMSMELADVYVRSKDEDVWHLEDFHFSGATALFKSAAAYSSTALAAAAALARLGGSAMEKKKKIARVAASGDRDSQLLVQALGAALGPVIEGAITKAFKPVTTMMAMQSNRLKSIAAGVDEMKLISIEAGHDREVAEDEETEEIEAEADENESEGDETEDIEAEGDEMEAKGKKKDDGDDGDGDGEDDGDDDEDLDAAMSDLGDDPASVGETGEENDGASNKGDKTTRTGGTGKSKSMAVKAAANRRVKAGTVIMGSATKSLIRELYASNRAMRKKFKTIKAQSSEKIETLTNQVEALQAQVENYAERVDRRSLPAELTNFLAKAGHDIGELRANGTKLSVSQIDEIFAAAPVTLDVTTRMWFKNQLVAANLMEQGEVVRG